MLDTGFVLEKAVFPESSPAFLVTVRLEADLVGARSEVGRRRQRFLLTTELGIGRGDAGLNLSGGIGDLAECVDRLVVSAGEIFRNAHVATTAVGQKRVPAGGFATTEDAFLHLSGTGGEPALETIVPVIVGIELERALGLGFSEL